MTGKKSFVILPTPAGWIVRRESGTRAAGVYSTQAEAWSEGRRRALGSGGEAVLHGKDGRIRARNLYGTDPLPRKERS
jgi:Uncharacterized protein conserved in bacteria (DUF2188)